ncbi:MAG: hypothetical protein B9S32_01895 [Verrucomicrobia bacterium Tous-C9LFEB]|nr:MAG: hypothetical protein B9S32_01895 [Verrucomicrobia bacterium Tous-C9LFEB]
MIPLTHRVGIQALLLPLVWSCLTLSARPLAAAAPEQESNPSAAAAVFDALDLTRPELAAVAAAWKKKDLAASEKEFAAYLRRRTSVQWGKATDGSPASAISPERQKRADDAAEGRVQGGLVPLVYAFPEGKIDWHFNATEKVPGQTLNYEWQWQLNRMSFWPDLAAAYRVTGDEKYARAFSQQLRSWIAQCPVPDHIDNVPRSSWRTIEAGIRTAWMWPEAFFGFLKSPSMSDADLVAFAGTYLDHARFLRTHNTRLNYLTMEMNGLYTAGTIFPEFKEATEWRTYAATRLAEETQNQFLRDGGQKELSTGYQNISLINLLRIVNVARWNQRESELSAGYLASLEKAYEWQMNLMTPDRCLPKINDSWLWPASTIFGMACTYFPDRAEFQWFRSGEKEGKAPAQTSLFLNRSGLAVMRSGWEQDANYLLFRMGPLGMGHQHQDGLGVILWAYGREMLFNGGGGSYEKSKWREWAVSTYSHNCLIIDGLAQSRKSNWGDPYHDPNMVSQGPIDAHWKSTPTFDFASGLYDQGYGKEQARPATQQRDVLYLKPDLYIVADRIRPLDALSHRYQARWQLLTTQTKIDPVTHLLVTGDPDKANLVVVPLLTDKLEVTSASAQEEPEILGWNIRKDLKPQNVPATTLLHTRSGTGPQTLLTLFIPLRAGQPNPVTKVTTGTDGYSATVTFADKRSLWISCAGERGIAVRETLPDGNTGRVVAKETP